jgi:hypothetical protein
MDNNNTNPADAEEHKMKIGIMSESLKKRLDEIKNRPGSEKMVHTFYGGDPNTNYSAVRMAPKWVGEQREEIDKYFRENK